MKNKKKFKLGVVEITTHENGFPKGLILKRDVTTRESKYILSTLLGFNLIEPSDCTDREEYRAFLNDYTLLVNGWLRGETSDDSVVDEICGGSEEQLGLMNMIPILAYLKKKGVIE